MAASAVSLQFAPTVAIAQEAATGTIHGRVLNATNGQYLNNARVTVEGTSLETFTNEFGDYTLNNVPAGSATLRVTFTGQEPQIVSVSVQGGQTSNQNVSFNAGKSTVDDDGTIVLNEFVVASERFKNAQDIATNEEHFSTNIKSVVATDSLGFIPGGNVGEFVKFLPGIQIGYGGDNRVDPSTASSIEVRGFGPDQTSIMIDGMPVSSANPGGLSRETGLDTLSINNASRIEVIKVATPDMENASAGGSINLITKSAFEYNKPTTTVSLYMTVNSEDTKLLKKEAGPTDEKSYHNIPSGTVSVSIPVNEKFGFTVSATSDNRYSPSQQTKTGWRNTPNTIDLRPIGGQNSTPVTDAQGRTSDLTNPYLSSFQATEYAWNSFTQSGNVKLDWKPITGMIVTGNVNFSRYTGYSLRHNLTFNTSTPIDWGSDYVIGRLYEPRTSGGTDLKPGNSAQMTVESFDKVGQTFASYIKASYTKGPIAIDASASRSDSRLRYDDLNNGHFASLDMTLNDVGQIRMDGISDGVPALVTITNRAGANLDYSPLSTWATDSTITGKTNNVFSKDVDSLYRLNVRYQLDFLPFDLAAKAGFQRRTKEQSKWGLGSGYQYRYIGPTLTSDDILDQTNTGSPGYGQPSQQWSSVYGLYDIYREHPEYFSDSVDVALQASNYKSVANTAKNVTETNDAYYGMIESKLFKNRLSIVAGVRQTSRKREGRMALTDSKWNYVKNADGSVYRDDVYRVGVKIDYSNAQKWDPITGEQLVYTNPDTQATTTTFPKFAYTEDTDLMARLAAANAVHPGHVLYGPNDSSGNPTQANSSNNNLEAAMLSVLSNQDISAKAKDPAVPQVQVAYRITDSLSFKAAWSHAVALPNLEGSAGVLANNGAFKINEEADPATAGRAGVIALSNAGLKPQETTSWDFELGYYFKTGSKISVSYYYKDIKNVWENVTVPSTASDYALLLASVGLNAADFNEWEITSTVNGAARSKNTGYEVDIRQNLGFLGRFGSHFDMFATYSHKDTKKSSESSTVYQILATSPDDAYSAGLMFSTERFQLAARGTYVGENFTRAGTVNYIDSLGVTNKIQTYTYSPETYKINLQADYRLSKTYSLFISGSNVLNAETKKKTIDAAYITPDYATTNALMRVGVAITAGINAKF